jgi:hypothetical protein
MTEPLTPPDDMYLATNILHRLGVEWAGRDKTIHLWSQTKEWLQSKKFRRSPYQVAMHYLSLLQEDLSSQSAAAYKWRKEGDK